MNYQTIMTDEKLIQFYLSGDPNAMATLVELYKDRVYQYIYNIVQDKFASEEIFQDAFICIINNMIAGKTAGEGNFLQWAIRIAQNLCVEHSRKNKLAEIMYSAAPEPRQISSASLVSGTNYHQSHKKIKSLIDMLPDDQREVMVLNHYGGLSFKEIAEVKKCSMNTALGSMQFGLNNLRKMMVETEMALN